MTFIEFGTVSPRSSLHSRVALALSHAAIDSHTQQKAITFGPVAQISFLPHDYVQDIINESTTVWRELTDHPFPRELAKGTAPLNGFRHYLIQDASYLEYYYRVRMESVSKSGSFQEITEFAAKLSNSLQYVTESRNDCTTKLGVPADVVANEPKSQQLQNSINLYEDVVKNGDWLDIHIVLLPCILGYDVIANALLKNPQTVRNTIYFPLWIQANSGGSSATRYKTFINNNIGALPAEERQRRWSTWVGNFQRACKTERDFFGLATPNVFPTYNIVSNGTYKIRNYHSGNFLASAVPPSVTTQAVVTEDHGLWRLTNTSDGYIVQHVSQGFLSASIRDAVEPLYKVHISLEQQRWSINPVQVYGEDGPFQAYQLLIPARLQFVLDAGNNVNDPNVFVANNSQISSQLWVLVPVV